MAIKMEGPLTKWTNVVQGWQYRWFVLDEYTGLLSYYTSKDKMMRGARRGCLRLKGAKIGINDEDDSTFTITCDHRTFHFQAQDASERTKWVKSLEETIMKHGSFGSPSPLNIPTEQELARKMQEAEAYFRLLTQQVKNVETQINLSANPKSERSLLLKESLTQMIESMGQTIELLHNAKVTLTKKVPVPVVGGKVTNVDSKPPINKRTSGLSQKSQNSNSLHSSPAKSVQSIDSHTSYVEIGTEACENIDKNEIVEVSNDTLNLNGETEVTLISNSGPYLNSEENFNTEITNSAELDHPESNIENVGPVSNYIQTVEHVPISSYTSSDEEEDVDEFFDANEQFEIDEMEKKLKLEEHEMIDRIKCGKGNKDQNDQKIITYGENNIKAPKRNLEFRNENSSDGYESEYDKEDDPFDDNIDGTDMQAHGSVITHLLSQVRIGMDLTKVTLPTFILERRSLLEMYADFFAHPNLFKTIPDLKDPGDRMIQVLKWYLSSFHAGRKSETAKKPYNPILGEIFQCFYDLTEDPDIRLSNDNYSKNGPTPWATKEDVSFVAEQVSHHPPISAFYAECENKRICFNCHLWTKSKFLGLSIGVGMVGTANVFVSDYNEEYVMTFPNGYGRSILTVPWIEMGGKTEITCVQSGYSVQLEFLTKPFYGGKRNRLTADVFAPNQKKPFMSVHGEWNGVMYAKYADAKETEIFIDTAAMSTMQKKVKIQSKQEEFESRRMWNDVTLSLKRNLIDNATAGKHKLEEKQRQDARIRKETNTQWQTRVFDEWKDGDDRIFFYKWPLYKRLGLPKPGSIIS